MGILCLQGAGNAGNVEFAVQNLEIREELLLEVKDGGFSSCTVERSCQQQQLNVFYVHMCTQKPHFISIQVSLYHFGSMSAP